MNTLLTARIDTTKLYGPFFSALDALLTAAAAQGHSYWAVSGFRTYGEQMALWAQGRTKPGKIVTQAQGGQSAHNFGIAVDLCLDGYVDRAGLQPDYRPDSYEPLRELAPQYGLVWGGAWVWPDRPHVQLPSYVTVQQMKPLRVEYERTGLLGVFTYLDGGITQ